MPTTTEKENGYKVLEMLTNFNDVSFEQKTDDIFLVNEPESGLNVVIDVEEKTIIFMIEIHRGIESISQELGELLLKINNDSAVHGAYGFDSKQNIIVFKDVLEIENLDQNELEASIISMILTVAKSIEEISKLL